MAFYQIVATMLVTLGTIVVAIGIVSAASPKTNDVGIYSIYAGLVMIGAGGISCAWRILRLKVRTKVTDLSKRSILFDEMYDGKEKAFENKEYEPYSVKKLRLIGERLQSDYSVLKYAKDNNMILITEDNENYSGCMENGISCVKLGQNPTVEEIEQKLEDLKTSY